MKTINKWKIGNRLSRILNEGELDVQPINTGTFNNSFWIKTSSGNRYVLRIAPNPAVPVLFYERHMMHQEPEVLQTISHRTTIPVPQVVYFDKSGSLLELDRACMLISALPGWPLSDRPVRHPHRIKQRLGEYLHQLHRIRGREFGYVGSHNPMSPEDTWWDAFRVMWKKLLEDIASIGAYRQREILNYQSLLNDHRSCFSGPRFASLLHMDLWFQNILTNGSEITGIIDWDHSLWGDPEMDLAQVEKSCLIDDHFWKGYGRKPEFDDAFFIRRAFYILYEHQKHIFIYAARYGDVDATQRHLRECHEQLKQIAEGRFFIRDPRSPGLPLDQEFSQAMIMTCDDQCWARS